LSMDSDIKMRSRGRWWKGHVYIHMPRLASEPPELDPLRGRNITPPFKKACPQALSFRCLSSNSYTVMAVVAAGGAAVVGCNTAGRSSDVCSGGSTVPAAVTIVVEHGARLSVGR
jgi:predicted small secreted protein